MSKNISNSLFLDTNIILDFLLQRESFVEETNMIFSLLEKGKIRAFTSSLSIANIYYIAQRSINSTTKTERLIQGITDFIKVLSVGEKEIQQAFAFNFNDFEDKIQIFTVLNNNISHFLTRDTSLLKLKSPVNIISSKEFLKKLQT